MPGLCFYYEPSDVDVWSGKNLDAWNYAAKAAGDIDAFWVVNTTEQALETPDAEMAFSTGASLPEIAGAVVKVVCPWDDAPGAVSLWSFSHQVDWYVFGPAAGWVGQVEGPSVYVPQAGLGALHSVHVASAVMLHRYKVLYGG